MKIFLFWIGNPDKITNLVETIKKQKLHVEVGPSVSEHNFLYENVFIYKQSYDRKIWAYCSDVWRVYKLSKEVGLYIDSSVEVGPKFVNFALNTQKYDTYIVKVSDSTIDGIVLGSGITNNIFYKDIFEFCKKIKIENPRVALFGGHAITYFACMHFGFKQHSKNFTQEFSSNSLIDTFINIRNKETIYKIGSNSWALNPVGGDYSDKVHQWFLEGKSKAWVARVKEIEKYGADAINCNVLRDTFDRTKDKSERDELKKIYVEHKKQFSFSKKLIWSQIYLLFRRNKNI